VPVYPSENLDERQFEHNAYAILALQGMIGDATNYQVALFSRDSSVLFKPDVAGDLIYNGIASRDRRDSFSNGLQNDFSIRLNDSHTIRFGLLASYENASSDTTVVFHGIGTPQRG
jgi:hypothetical protein